MEDLNPILPHCGLNLVEEQNVAAFSTLNIKRCRVQSDLGQYCQESDRDANFTAMYSKDLH
jgi:hypothetical protein